MSGADQEAADDTGHGETSDLGGEDQEHAGDKGFFAVVPELLQDDDIDSVGGTTVTGDHGADQDVLLDGERAWVEREAPATEVELVSGQNTGH